MGKILAFDYGGKRTGLAITDELQIIASPLEGIDTNDIWDHIQRLMNSEKISDFVVGDPSIFGDATDSSAMIDQFCKDLAKKYPAIPLHRVDESYSSRDAMQAMVAGGMRKKNRRNKKNLDMVSAAVILQRFLESRV
ncbi:MAG: Holliday junction resolvase RuvX [Flavobacteriales bacterium]|nr:Holliday junction resolvase RuvX [Flavobacteriales bacterium]